jgi:hypothetical protein
VREALTKHVNEPVVLAKHVGLPRVPTGVRDHGGDVDARVIRIGEQHRHNDCVAAALGQYVAQVGGVLLAERHPNVDIASHHHDGVRYLIRRCRRARIGAAVRRQDERGAAGGNRNGHEACNPHSVLDWPAQRPLRGSVPSAGLAVHGAQPIDG